MWFHNLCCCFRLNRVLNKSCNSRTYKFFELIQPSEWWSQGQAVSKYPVYIINVSYLFVFLILIAGIFFPSRFSYFKKVENILIWVGRTLRQRNYTIFDWNTPRTGGKVQKSSFRRQSSVLFVLWRNLEPVLWWPRCPVFH